MKVLEGKANWLLSEFIQLAPAQFIDELVCEMTVARISNAGRKALVQTLSGHALTFALSTRRWQFRMAPTTPHCEALWASLVLIEFNTPMNS